MNESGILIVGANGQLGKALQARYPKAKAVDIDTFNVGDRAAVESYNWSGITIILNAAAYTNVDGAETHEGRIIAWQANAVAPANLARIAQQKDITLVHISTDYVFDGTQNPHLEDEPFSPLSVYGTSKAAGDIAVSLAPKYYILRTSWVIGDGKNFVRTMLELGQKGVNPTVVSDQVGRLTFTSELVRAIVHLLDKDAPHGMYNVSNDGGSESWADITRTIFKEAGLSNTVTDISTVDYYQNKENIAPRPSQSTLSLDKIKGTGFVPKEWSDNLKSYLKKELSV